MTPATHTLLTWLGWFAGCIAMSLLSGWWLLARRFPARAGNGERWYFVSGSVTRLRWLPIQYHATFFVTVDEAGIRLSVFFPVRLLHPPLFLPWAAIGRVSSCRFLHFFRQTELEIVGSPVRLRIRGSAGRALLARHAGRQEQAGALLAPPAP